MFASRVERAGRACGLATATAALLALLAPPAPAEEPTTAGAREALMICQSVEGLPESEQLARLDRGLALAERAIAERPDDPVGHFAAFCNRGRRLQLEGLSLHLFGEMRQTRRDLERALELVPDWPDAIAAKGAMLLALPRSLGGDRTEGERLLRRAVALDPSNLEARRRLEEAGVVGPFAGAVAHVGRD
jgi:hypothetical protein